MAMCSSVHTTLSNSHTQANPLDFENLVRSLIDWGMHVNIQNRHQAIEWFQGLKYTLEESITPSTELYNINGMIRLLNERRGFKNEYYGYIAADIYDFCNLIEKCKNMKELDRRINLLLYYVEFDTRKDFKEIKPQANPKNEIFRLLNHIRDELIESSYICGKFKTLMNKISNGVHRTDTKKINEIFELITYCNESIDELIKNFDEEIRDYYDGELDDSEESETFKSEMMQEWIENIIMEYIKRIDSLL
mgnify:CR=1 FL=1